MSLRYRCAPHAAWSAREPVQHLCPPMHDACGNLWAPGVLVKFPRRGGPGRSSAPILPTSAKARLHHSRAGSTPLFVHPGTHTPMLELDVECQRHLNYLCVRPECELEMRGRDGDLRILCTIETALGCLEFSPPLPVHVQCMNFRTNGECLPSGARTVTERECSSRVDRGHFGHR